MFLKNVFVSLVVLGVAVLMSACAMDDCGVTQVDRAASSIKAACDARTGLCFVYSVERGGSRYGLSQLDCETVEHSLARHHGASSKLMGQLRYGRLTGVADRSVCLAYAEGDGGNMRSNLAVVPCEPVLRAWESSDLPLRQLYP